MKNKLNLIKVLVMITAFVLLAGFAHMRHQESKIESIEIGYAQNEHIFINEMTVNKLLIQNKIPVKNINVEKLDLNSIEKQVESHPMVENAEVYVDIQGNLHADISQRKPLARVLGDEQYYIDSKGIKMPLSEHYSARVPIVTGLNENDIDSAFKIIKHINEDLFLKQNITQIKSYPNGRFGLRMRNQKFKIFVGKAELLNQKFLNFKAFYIKAKKDSLLHHYKRIDLQYGNQVVCEKTES
jgi:cell division protein FtsQ